MLSALTPIAALLGLVLGASVSFFYTSGLLKIFAVFSAYLTLALYMRIFSIKPEMIGIDRKTLKDGIKWGTACGLIISLVIGAVYLFSTDTFLVDRYNQGSLSLMLTLFVTLPIFTVLYEEIVFRGIMPFIFGRRISSNVAILIWTSALFGLWHILPALTQSSSSIFSGSIIIARPIVVLASMIAPFFAGLVLLIIRQRSNSLIAPIIVHYTINASGMVFAYIAWSSQ